MLVRFKNDVCERMHVITRERLHVKFLLRQLLNDNFYFNTTFKNDFLLKIPISTCDLFDYF